MVYQQPTSYILVHKQYKQSYNYINVALLVYKAIYMYMTVANSDKTLALNVLVYKGTQFRQGIRLITTIATHMH